MTKSIIKLDSNENPLGASPYALEAGLGVLQHAHRYHDGEYTDLKSALATFLSVHLDQITVGNGSENILEIIIKACCRRGSTAIISQYSFITIPFLLNLHHIPTTIVPTINWQQDLDNIVAAINKTTRIIFLVNPSNPTGTYFNASDFLQFMQRVPSHIFIVIDEAYYEYIYQPDFPHSISLLDIYPNLIIVRTFSKGYGLAALRIGYAISTKQIALQLNNVRLPYHVNSVAIHAACAALQDQAHVTYSSLQNQLGYKQLIKGLDSLQLPYLNSVGNFISVNVQDAEKICLQLKENHIFVKSLHQYKLPNYIRVTIGTETQITAFLSVLAQII